jgi:hypothetical protein
MIVGIPNCIIKARKPETFHSRQLSASVQTWKLRRVSLSCHCIRRCWRGRCSTKLANAKLQIPLSVVKHKYMLRREIEKIVGVFLLCLRCVDQSHCLKPPGHSKDRSRIALVDIYISDRRNWGTLAMRRLRTRANAPWLGICHEIMVSWCIAAKSRLHKAKRFFPGGKTLML